MARPDVRLVLLRPRNAQNLGAVARAMNSCGLSGWCLVQPNPKLLEEADARRLAVHSEDLISQVELVDDLKTAVSDCSWVVGTSMRKVPGLRRVSPRELAAAAMELEGKVALVFGDERSGLTNRDLEHCHALSGIPTDERQPSLNLAQAVMVYCYELRLASLGAQTPKAAKEPPHASDRELSEVEATLRRLLQTAGFLREPERHAVLDLMRPLQRSALTRSEARLWATALRVLEKSRGPPR
jgi:TrmH family RNA methyltransferase